MFRSFLRSLSTTVHEEQRGEEQPGLPESIYNRIQHQKILGEENLTVKGSSDRYCKSLTVWRKSLLVSCNGFTVIDSWGNLVYRVDNYTHRPREVILMDAAGKSVLTMHRRKKLGIIDSWMIYEGETRGDIAKPICSVTKQINVLSHATTKSKVLAHVSACSKTGMRMRRGLVIEGSYLSRWCKVVEEESREVVAEVRRKEEMVGGVSFGLEVFLLVVKPGFESGFAMALVLLLDQMFS